MAKSIDELCINTIRFLAVDAVEKANSGHPGMPMGDAAMAYVLWTRHLRHNPANPLWPGRDRFVLSAGHGSMLLYSLLHLTGYDLPLSEIKNFRQWGSRTPGHPEYDPLIGVEMTTGPLGQGFATAVGMAVAQRHLAATYNRTGYPLFDYNTYIISSDGDMMEGVTNEAASFAGHHGLGSVICLYSDNHITIEGSTDLAFTEDVGARFEALKWHVQKVDGDDLDGVDAAIKAAKEATNRPSLIIARTHIGHGSPNKQDTGAVHGSPLGRDEIELTKKRLGWPLEPEFLVPEEASLKFREAAASGARLEAEWNALFDDYYKEYDEEAGQWRSLDKIRAQGDWVDKLPEFGPGDGPMATRSASGKCLNAIASRAPFLIGGSADLSPSNNTYLDGEGDFLPGSPGRNMHFGVREHAMGAIMNGIALSRGLVPYGGTFLIFSDYMRPAIRLASLMRLNLVYVFTHDSIGLGEDGPTHQPIEHLASLRAMPNLVVIRPACANETVEAWKVALSRGKGPVVLVLTRQKLPVLDRDVYNGAEGVSRGAYVLADTDDKKPDIILIATGSEVSLALDASAALAARGVKPRVVSMPSWELFEEQDEDYRLEVLPPEVTARVSIEAASPMGWERYVGIEGTVIGIDRFGASAPYKTIYDKFGLSIDNIVSKSLALINRTKGRLEDGC